MYPIIKKRVLDPSAKTYILWTTLPPPEVAFSSAFQTIYTKCKYMFLNLFSYILNLPVICA